MLDLLKATTELYGDCSQEADSSDVYINGKLPTAIQMDAILVRASEIDVRMAQQAINQEALAYLNSTDWLLWRELDGGKAMPLNIKQLRVEARVSIV